MVDKIEELEQMMIMKEQELNKIRDRLTKTEEELQEKSELLENKQEEI